MRSELARLVVLLLLAICTGAAAPAARVVAASEPAASALDTSSATRTASDRLAVSSEGGDVVLGRAPQLGALCIGGSVLLVALFSAWLRRRWVTGPMVCLSIGIVLGPQVLGVYAPLQWPHHLKMLEFVARATLAVSLMAAALHLPRRWYRQQWGTSALFIALAMVAMWGASTVLMRVVLQVDWLEALLLGAIVTPTDPVLAATIVTGPLAQKQIPERIRDLLQIESAANDGLAFPFVMLSILLLFRTVPDALRHWGLYVVGWQVVGASVAGAVAGVLVGRVQRVSTKHDLSQFDALLTVSMSLAIMVAGAIRVANGDGILAVFVAGMAFRLCLREDDLLRSEEQVQETVQRLFQLPIFVLFGMMLPWSDWFALGWRAPILVTAVLLLRRIPAILLAKPLIGPIRTWPEALFCGWFGPIGISALFYAALSRGFVNDPLVWPATSLIITASTFVHGVTATPLARLLGNRRRRSDCPTAGEERSTRRASARNDYRLLRP